MIRGPRALIRLGWGKQERKMDEVALHALRALHVRDRSVEGGTGAINGWERGAILPSHPLHIYDTDMSL